MNMTRLSGFCKMKAWPSSWMRGTTMWLPFTRRTAAGSLILSASSRICLTQGPAAFTIALARTVRLPRSPSRVAVHSAPSRCADTKRVWVRMVAPCSAGERLGDEPEFEVLQVAKAAVDELGRGRRGRRGEIVLLDQQHFQAPAGGIARDTRAVDAAADDQEIVMPGVHAGVDSMSTSERILRESERGGGREAGMAGASLAAFLPQNTHRAGHRPHSPYRRLFPLHGEHGLDGDRDFPPGHRRRYRREPARAQARADFLSRRTRGVHTDQRLGPPPPRLAPRGREAHPRVRRRGAPLRRAGHGPSPRRP